MRDYLAFDIEIASQIPEGAEDWDPYRPFGISCAAVAGGGGGGRIFTGAAADGSMAERLSREEAVELVRFLIGEAEAGRTLLTWNGAGFDFRVLAEESGLFEECRALALGHVDMMFHFFCLKGFGLGLDKAAKGMGLRGKPAGMTGALAPLYWQQGRRQEVLDYVRQDVVTTLEVCEAVERIKALYWWTDRGKQQSAPISKGWLTVSEAMALPLPDTSWMKTPWPRSKFTGWMG
jgi:hypothetical protein